MLDFAVSGLTLGALGLNRLLGLRLGCGTRILRLVDSFLDSMFNLHYFHQNHLRFLGRSPRWTEKVAAVEKGN